MGMLSYDMLFLHENSRIVYKQDYLYTVSGVSDLPVSQIRNLLAETCTCERIGKGEHSFDEWVFDDCISILVYQKDGWFQGFFLKGCFAYFNKGVEQCYTCYERWSKTIPLQIYVMNKPVQPRNGSELRDIVAKAYKEIIELFRRQYGDIEWKVSNERAFHREVRRRQSLWYRLSRYFHREK